LLTHPHGLVMRSQTGSRRNANATIARTTNTPHC